MPQIDVRMERHGEESRVSEIVRDAFKGEAVVSLLEALRESSAWRGLSFVATADDLPIAHIAFTRGWLDAPARLVEVLILSPVSVASGWQRKGIGSKLIREALTLLADRDEPLVFLEGDPRYYSRLGFLPGIEAGFISPSLRIPPRAFQYIKLPNYAEWMTGTLVYPDVFWENDSVGLREASS